MHYQQKQVNPVSSVGITGIITETVTVTVTATATVTESTAIAACTTPSHSLRIDSVQLYQSLSQSQSRRVKNQKKLLQPPQLPQSHPSNREERKQRRE